MAARHKRYCGASYSAKVIICAFKSSFFVIPEIVEYRVI